MGAVVRLEGGLGARLFRLIGVTSRLAVFRLVKPNGLLTSC